MYCCVSGPYYAITFSKTLINESYSNDKETYAHIAQVTIDCHITA